VNLLKISHLKNKRYSLAISLAGGIFLIFGSFISIFMPNEAKAISISPPRLELEGDPGETISSEFKVTNDTANSATYYTQVENFEAKDESGSPQFVQSKEGLAVWTSVAGQVNIPAGEQRAIPFSVRIPRNAEPGGYFASIFVRTTPPSTGANEVSIGARLGTLILLRVNGEIQEGVDILEFSTKDKKRFYTSLPVELYYRFQNTGNDRVKPEGDVIIKNLIGLKAKILSANRSDGSVLPRSIRRFDMAWINGRGGQEDPDLTAEVRNPGNFFEEVKYQWSHFALGYYTANLDITYGVNNHSATGTFRFFVVPWQLLIIIIGGLIIVLIILRFILRRYNRYIISKHQPRQ
jgi:hypothetical protein